MRSLVGPFLVLVISVAATAPQGRAGAADPVRERIVETLNAFDGDWGDVPALSREMALEGAPAVPVLVDLLADGALSVESDEDLEPLGDRRRTGVELALGQLPLNEIRSSVDRLAGAGARLRHRIVALDLLARLGDLDDLERIGAIAAGGEPPPPRAALDAYRGAVQSLLSQEPDARAAFCATLGRIDPLLVSTALDAVVRLGGDDVFDVLTHGLGRGVDALVLLQLARLSDRPGVAVSEMSLEQVRSRLRGGDDTVILLATEVVSDLEDHGAIPDLIEALASVDGARRAPVRAALRSLTPVDLGTRPQAWIDWYDAQLDWLTREADACADRLAAGDAREARLALQASMARSFFRPTVIEHLELALRREEPDLVIAACVALPQLGDASSLPALVRVLDRDEANIQTAAREALARIARTELPDDPQKIRVHLATLGFEL